MTSSAAARIAVAALLVAGAGALTLISALRANADRAARGGGVVLAKVGNFDEPTYVTGAPGFPRLLFVTERAGEIEVMRNGRKVGTFLSITGRVSQGGERGLFSVAFPPGYKKSKRFYVYYTDNEGDLRIDEYRRRSATRARKGSRRGLLEIPHRANTNHNGGQLQFNRGLLFIATGDGGSAGDPPENAQNKRKLLGKLLRIDPRNPPGKRRYSVPRSNPFVGRKGRNEIYALGLRNPYRFSFDTAPKADRIVIGDVGQGRFEEVDYEKVGGARRANFGWDAFEGFARFDSSTPPPRRHAKPIFVYGRDRGCTIIGGFVVRDPRLPALRGRYVYTDYCGGQLRSLVPRLGRARGDRPLGIGVGTPISFGQDQRRRIYVASQGGSVFRLVPAG